MYRNLEFYIVKLYSRKIEKKTLNHLAYILLLLLYPTFQVRKMASAIPTGRYSIPYPKDGSNKDAVLKWKEDVNGTVFTPMGRPGSKGAYVLYDKNDGPTDFPDLESFLDGLDERGLKFAWYQIIIGPRNYLIPSHSVTMARFVRLNFKGLYKKWGEPKKVKFNPKTWEFAKFTKSKLVSDKMTFVQGQRLIGKGGVVTKAFNKNTGCYYRVFFKKEDNNSNVKIMGPPKNIESATGVLMAMIEIAKTQDINVEDIPTTVEEDGGDEAASGGGAVMEAEAGQ